jgi:hypothetical protein
MCSKSFACVEVLWPVQTVPSLKTIANFEVQFIWILYPYGSDTVLHVHVRVVFHGTAWGIGSIIKNQSVSQSVTSYNALRQRLMDRFPMQHGNSVVAPATINQDIHYALALARQAAQRMPAGLFPVCLCLFSLLHMLQTSDQSLTSEHSAPFQEGDGS